MSQSTIDVIYLVLLFVFIRVPVLLIKALWFTVTFPVRVLVFFIECLLGIRVWSGV